MADDLAPVAIRSTAELYVLFYRAVDKNKIGAKGTEEGKETRTFRCHWECCTGKEGYPVKECKEKGKVCQKRRYNSFENNPLKKFRLWVDRVLKKENEGRFVYICENE